MRIRSLGLFGGSGRLLASAVGATLLLGSAARFAAGCVDDRSLRRVSGSYKGEIVRADFVRRGFPAQVEICIDIDGPNLASHPGTITTSDGHFRATNLRAIPELEHDALGSFSLGLGHDTGTIFAAQSSSPGDNDSDALVFVSTTSSNELEVRIVRGAPDVPREPPTSRPTPLYGVFALRPVASSCVTP